MTVSRNRPEATDRYEKIADPTKAKKVGLAIISSPAEGALSCSCGGWASTKARRKSREDAAQRHLNRRHGGAGVWM